MELTEPSSTSSDEFRRENEALHIRLSEAESKLAEAQELIQAIRSGDVDAVVVSGPYGDRIYTLEHAEYAYRALVEAMNEGAATLGADGIVLYCNRRLSHLLGVPLEQIIGSPVARLASNETVRVFEALLAQALTGEACRAELYLQNAGKLIPVQVSLNEMRSVEPIALCLVVTDLTERRERDEIIAQGKLATSILESAAEGIAVCDPAGKVITTNEALDNLCGFNPLFKHFDEALPLELIDGPATPGRGFSISDALAGNTFRSREVRFRRNDGRTVSLLLSASPIRNFSLIVGCVLTMTDITERKLAETALLRSEKLASVGRMASTIAHEINNPLEAVGNLLYLATIDPLISGTVKSYLERAVEELDRVSHITQQALAFHRDTNAPTVIDLHDTVNSILKLFASRLKAKGIKVKTRYRGNGQIIAMGGEIRQVIANVLSNSLDAVRSGGRIEMRIIRTSGRDMAPVVRFSIGDTGSGITSERLKKVFEPFFTTKEMVGTGLGLWVSKQILEKHGAKIRVKSQPGKGTVFTIAFPVDGPASKASGFPVGESN